MATNTTNDTEYTPCPEDLLSTVILKAFSYIIVLILSFVGNGMVLHIFFKNRAIRTTTNSFIVNMAASDIMIPVFVIPRHIAAAFEKGQSKLHIWHVDGYFGELLCKVIPFIGDVSHCVSILTLMLIAVDRYIAICWPLTTKYKITPRRCNIFIAATWIVGVVINAPYFYTFKLNTEAKDLRCVMFWGPMHNITESDWEFHDKAQKFYALGIVLLIYLIPLATITILYSSIIQELRSKQRMQSVNQSTNHRRQRRREDNRVIAMLVVVVTIFAVFFAPFHISQFILSFVWNYRPYLGCHEYDLTFSCTYLTLAICCINPYIYFVFLRRYRKCAKDLLKSICGARILTIAAKIRSWKCLKRNESEDDETRRNTGANSSYRTRQTDLVLLTEQDQTLQFETGL